MYEAPYWKRSIGGLVYTCRELPDWLRSGSIIPTVGTTVSIANKKWTIVEDMTTGKLYLQSETASLDERI